MDTTSLAHYPVFYREVLENIEPLAEKWPDMTVVDCTVGSGGHSSFLLKSFPDIKVIGFERDPKMAARAKENLAPFGERFSLINDNFSRLPFYFKGMEKSIGAILYDFGISSWHLDGDKRGFAIKESGAYLDMRLDRSCKHSASEIVNEFREQEIADIIYKYGEERHSRKIARYICFAREKKRIETTDELAQIVYKARPPKGHKRGGPHPATKTFQALRIFINSELEAIESALEESWKFCREGGRILSISFHSLEDRIVKNGYRSLARGCYCETQNNPQFCQCDRISRIKILTKKPIVPSDLELDENSRSKSAKLRVCEIVS